MGGQQGACNSVADTRTHEDPRADTQTVVHTHTRTERLQCVVINTTGLDSSNGVGASGRLPGWPPLHNRLVRGRSIPRADLAAMFLKIAGVPARVYHTRPCSFLCRRVHFVEIRSRDVWNILMFLVSFL